MNPTARFKAANRLAKILMKRNVTPEDSDEANDIFKELGINTEKLDSLKAKLFKK